MVDCIRTERLTLRRYHPDDAVCVADLIGNLAVSKWLTRVPHPYAVQDAANFIDLHCAKSDLIFAITLHDEVIGGISAGEELGYWLGQPFWRRGYATEAAQTLVCHFFEQRADVLSSGHIVNNVASQAVLRKLGFVDTHVEDVASAALGHLVQVQKMALSRDHWQALQ